MQANTRKTEMENDGPNQSRDWSRKEQGRDQKSNSNTTTDRRCQLMWHTKKKTRETPKVLLENLQLNFADNLEGKSDTSFHFLTVPPPVRSSDLLS